MARRLHRWSSSSIVAVLAVMQANGASAQAVPDSQRAPPSLRQVAWSVPTLRPPKFPTGSAFTRQADSLEGLDPVAEAVAAAERGELRVLSICSMGCRDPGIPRGGTAARRLQDIPRRVISTTSDAISIESWDQQRLEDVAFKFAQAYNLATLRYLQRLRASR